MCELKNIKIANFYAGDTNLGVTEVTKHQMPQPEMF